MTVTTLIPFTPSLSQAFQFQPTLDGVLYSAVVTWNSFAQRYYLNLYDLSGNLILATGLTESGPQLLSSLTWGDTLATATTQQQHNIPVGVPANITVTGTGGVFDGNYQALAIDAFNLTFTVLQEPVVALPLAGNVNFNLNMVAPLGLGLLLYHSDAQTFEFA
jgi:hypothetical protein